MQPNVMENPIIVPESLERETVDVANILLKTRAIGFWNGQEPYTFTSGMKSPIYCDLRKVFSYPGLREQLYYHLAGMAKRHVPTFNVIAGVATGSLPTASRLATLFEKPLYYCRPSQKGHGKRNKVEGATEHLKGQNVLVVEDLISTGGSCLSAAADLRAAGASVEAVLGVFSYQFPEAQEAFRCKGVKGRVLLDYPLLIGMPGVQRYLPEGSRDVLESWHKDPWNWNPENTLSNPKNARR